jgi:hypothetical protein
MSVPGTIKWTEDNMSFVFNPFENLTEGETYTIWLSEICNITFHPVLHRDWTSVFTTVVINGNFSWVEGYVFDGILGDPIPGAVVSTGGMSTTTGAAGYYFLLLQPGIYDITASKTLYQSETNFGVEIVVFDIKDNVNFTLVPIINIDVHMVVDGTLTELVPESTPQDAVDISSPILMEFDEAINISTLGTTNLKDNSGMSVTGTMKWEPELYTLTFTPDENLTYGLHFILTIDDSVTNITGSPILPRDVTWEFLTWTNVHVPPPKIFPADGATDVALDAEVKIDFYIEMNTTATEVAINATFNIYGFTWDMYNQSVILEHELFDYNTEYKITISAQAISAEGYYQMLTRSSTFTTISRPEPEYEYKVGRIIYENETIASGASITILDDDGNTVWTGISDENGSIIITLSTQLSPGNYTIIIIKDGFKKIMLDLVINETGGLDNGDNLFKFEPDDEPPGNKDSGDDNEINLLILAIVLVIIVIIIFIIFVLIKKSDKLFQEQNGKDSKNEAVEDKCINCGTELEDPNYCQHCGWTQETLKGPMKVSESDESYQDELEE